MVMPMKGDMADFKARGLVNLVSNQESLVVSQSEMISRQDALILTLTEEVEAQKQVILSQSRFIEALEEKIRLIEGMLNDYDRDGQEIT